MNRSAVLEAIKDTGIVAIVRGTSADTMLEVAEALFAGGVRAVEVTMNTPGAVDMIRAVSAAMGDRMLVGVGTVLDAQAASAAILAGAQFVLAPNVDEEVIHACHMHGKLVVPGAYTASEVVKAWKLGVSIVKIFPAGSAGPRYIRELRGPLNNVDMMAVGGVNINNAADFIRAGACSLGIGSELVNKVDVAEGRFDLVTQKARDFVAVVREARRSQG